MDRFTQWGGRALGSPARVVAVILFLPVLLTGATQCNSRPDFAVAFIASTSNLEFGESQTTLSFNVAKVATSRTAPNFTVSASQPWIKVTPLTGNSSGPESPALITVTVNRAEMNVGFNSGQITISAPGVQPITVGVTAISRIRASFSISPTLPTAGVPVNFTNTSQVAAGQPPLNIFVWNFGDGSPVSTLENPVHIFANMGIFPVTLTVTNGVVSDSRTIMINVGGVVGPTADFNAAPRNPQIGQSVQFTDLSIPGTGTISSWMWDFGDGTTSTLSNPTHIYTIAAAYSVYLVVTTEFGSDDEVKVDFINVQPAGPTADFTADDTTPVSGQTVQFMDMSLPGSFPINSWIWSFGDGTTSTLSDPTHIYTINGLYVSQANYTVSLTVSTNAGVDTEIKQNFITVTP